MYADLHLRAAPATDGDRTSGDNGIRLGAALKPTLEKFFRGVELFRFLDPGIPSQTMAVFLAVARADDDEGVYQIDLVKSLAMTQASVSRNVAALTKRHRRGHPGLDLIERREDEDNRSLNKLFLTPKGRHFRDQLLALAG